MKKLLFFAGVLFLVVCFFGNIAFGGDVEVSGIKTKILVKKDSGGDTKFAIKATVKNLGDKDSVYVTLQAIDREGFELKDIDLSGKVRPGQSRTLTDQTYMPYDLFKKISKWQVK